VRNPALDASLALGTATVLDARRTLAAGRKTTGWLMALWLLAESAVAQHGRQSPEEAGTER
jgi:hypothetical protein